MKSVKELRIGNLVKCKTSNDSAYYAISAIDGMHYRVMLTMPRDGEWIPIEKIKPIKLNEEILLDLDFVKLDFNQFNLVIGNNSQITVWFNKLELHTLSGIKYRDIDVEYLHQLQNLYYSLTGEELKF